MAWPTWNNPLISRASPTEEFAMKKFALLVTGLGLLLILALLSPFFLYKRAVHGGIKSNFLTIKQYPVPFTRENSWEWVP